jgi:hypothetical protein
MPFSSDDLPLPTSVRSPASDPVSFDDTPDLPLVDYSKPVTISSSFDPDLFRRAMSGEFPLHGTGLDAAPSVIPADMVSDFVAVPVDEVVSPVGAPVPLVEASKGELSQEELDALFAD